MGYDKNNPLRVFEAFAGYGSQCLALERLKRDLPDFDYRLVGWSEIDKYAITAHNALHPEATDLNLGDISKIDWEKVPDFDLFTYSWPCTDVSTGGKQAGFTEGSGTRSSLLWECRTAIAVKRPKYLLMENVKALVSDKFAPGLKKWILWLQHQGYRNYAKVLNARDYGVPQNRERVFMVSILDDGGETEPYYFPKPFQSEKRLKHVLEDNVDESYYLPDDKVTKIIARCEERLAEMCGLKPKNTEGKVIPVGNIYYGRRASGFAGNVYDPDGISPTIIALGGGNSQPMVTRHERIDYKWMPDGSIRGFDTRDTSGIAEEQFTSEDTIADTVTTSAQIKVLLTPQRDDEAKAFRRANHGYDTFAGRKLAPKPDQAVADCIVTSTGSANHGDQLIAHLDPTEVMVSSHPLSHAAENPMPRSEYSPTLRATDHKCPPCAYEPPSAPQYGWRIRKITPREAFRLMDVDDADIDKMQAAGISKSQQYKLAGNSIVVACMHHIFRNLFTNATPHGQLALF